MHNYTHILPYKGVAPSPLPVHGINGAKEPRGLREKFSAYPSHHMYSLYSVISQDPTTISWRKLQTEVLL